jgi:hypothetical protein
MLETSPTGQAHDFDRTLAGGAERRPTGRCRRARKSPSPPESYGTVFEGFRVNAIVTKAHLEQEAG